MRTPDRSVHEPTETAATAHAGAFRSLSPVARAWVQIHFCVVLWGATAILGKLITLPAYPLVLWRMGLVGPVLLAWPPVLRQLRGLRPAAALAFAGVGLLVALHWLTFYAAVKLANASVAATCMALVPVFVSVIEPLLTRRGFERRELVLGLLVVPGVAGVVGGTPTEMNAGIACGAVSALFVAIFGSLNKRLVDRADPLVTTALEMTAGGVFLAAAGLALSHLPEPWLEGWIGERVRRGFAQPGAWLAWPDGRDLGLLLTLAWACTLLPFSLSLVALRHLSAYATSLAVNLEPVYAILLGVLLLQEQRELSLGFYAGATILIACVLGYPALMSGRVTHGNSDR